MKRKVTNVAPAFSVSPDLAVKSALNSMVYHASYILRREKAKSENLIPLYLRITYNQKRVEISLNLYVHPDQWEGQKFSIEKKLMSKKDIKAVNDTIDLYTYKLRSIFNDLKAQNVTITANVLKDKLLDREQPKIIEKKKTVLDTCNYYIKEIEIQSKHGEYAEATTKKYQYLANHLSNFMYCQYGQKDIPVEQVDLFFVKQFFCYLLEEKNFKDTTGKIIVKKRCRNNSAVKYMKNFKTVMRRWSACGILLLLLWFLPSV